MMNLTMPPITPVAFDGAIVFGWIAVFLIVGMLCRAKFPLFRRYLIPSCIIGGTIGFICQSSGLIDLIGFPIDSSITQHLVFHVFNLTWVFIGLKVPEKTNSETSSMRTVIAYFSIANVVLFFAHAVVLTATILLATIGLNSGPATLGSLTTYAFMAGPGQALTIANLWSASTSYAGLADYALASGATGYALAIIVGIFLINIIARKKNLALIETPSPEEEKGFYNADTNLVSAGKQTTSATSIDTLAWHIALGLATYLVAFILAVVIYLILPGPLKIFIWSMFFLFVTTFAMGVRIFIIKQNLGHLLCNDINNRISNTLVDFLVCATFISIQLGEIARYILPYLSSVILSTTILSAGLWFYCRKIKEDGLEYFAFVFGALMGTISSAFILLRLIDPQGKSAVPVRMALASAISITVNILLPAIMHMEPLYNLQPWFSVLSMLAASFVLAILVRLSQLPQTKEAWKDDK